MHLTPKFKPSMVYMDLHGLFWLKLTLTAILVLVKFSQCCALLLVSPRCLPSSWWLRKMRRTSNRPGMERFGRSLLIQPCWTILDHTGPYYCTYQPLGPHPSVLFFPYQYQGLSWNFSESCQWLVCALGGRTYHAIHGIHDIHDIHSFQGQGRRCLRSFSQRWDASWRPTTFVPILASPAVKPSVVHHALRTASWGLGGKKSRGMISEA